MSNSGRKSLFIFLWQCQSILWRKQFNKVKSRQSLIKSTDHIVYWRRSSLSNKFNWEIIKSTEQTTNKCKSSSWSFERHDKRTRWKFFRWWIELFFFRRFQVRDILSLVSNDAIDTIMYLSRWQFLSNLRFIQTISISLHNALNGKRSHAFSYHEKKIKSASLSFFFFIIITHFLSVQSD